MSTFPVIHLRCLQTFLSSFVGMFGTAVSSSHPGVALSFEQGDTVAKLPTDPSGGIHSHALSGSHLDSDDSPHPDEPKVSHTLSNGKSQCIIEHFQLPKFHLLCFLPMHLKERVKNTRFGRDKIRPQHLDQQEEHSGQGDNERDKIRHRVKQMLSDSPTEENRVLIIKGMEILTDCFYFA